MCGPSASLAPRLLRRVSPATGPRVLQLTPSWTAAVAAITFHYHASSTFVSPPRRSRSSPSRQQDAASSDRLTYHRFFFGDIHEQAGFKNRMEGLACLVREQLFWLHDLEDSSSSLLGMPVQDDA
ncbi:uncharacterized protein FOMMEDRAFT_166977 [Fomitiporia mediterranea MF3/22]|uniref:uncharacterized protein n=1 Tax=Fomitiporia mediterranea (strain MF3/22) TaxID=694068 RepID=UPI0004408A82|nr:uncharacterized protein FOMMEDRAFT_166977 [Fomitiporia mediterranea MF3/22]EJD03624.1 hypothetical protein FOMMEDRAFT_166977 [Fomitiporia mediterranea MF3/22]